MHGVVLEDRRLLELAPDAELGNLRLIELGQVVAALEIDVAFIGPRLTGDDVHHRRLAGAVGTDDRAHLPRRQDQRQAAQRLVAIERNADAIEIEQRSGQNGVLRFDHDCASLAGAPPDGSPATVSGMAGFLRSVRVSASPRMPLGRNKVTRTKRPPSAKSQYSGKAPVK